MFDLGRQLSDLEGKNSKFRRVAFLCIATKNIFMCFQHSPIQTVGGVRESAQNPHINGNDLGVLDIDLVTLRPDGCVDLDN